jgi:UDP-4-amino-4-deoxy-L-arabinose-oxoglutarate aminotransferase
VEAALKVEFYRHNLGERELRRLAEVLEGPILTTGAAVAEFERRFAEYLGVEHVIGVTSCTAALHLALLAYDIGPGDEVITTPMTFVATANAIIHAGAEPVFVDVEPTTGNLDAGRVEAAITPRTRAIMPVHLYGQMCDMRALRAIADQHDLRIIEDCAHCIEAVRDGVRPGQLGDVACFSFYATKNITCGEGGALSAHDAAVADRLRTLRLHGMSKGAAERHTRGYEHWDVEEVGWKYNMDNIQGALLIDQIGDMEGWWKRREEICVAYERAFSAAGIEFPKTVGPGRSARHLFTILVEPVLRDPLLKAIQAAGVGVAVNYRAVHLLAYYVKRFGFARGAFPIAESIGDRTISLPLYPRMTDEEVAYVIDSVVDNYRALRSEEALPAARG